MLVDTVNHGLVAARCLEPADYGWRAPPTVLEDGEWKSIQVPALFPVGENEVLYSPRKAVQRLNQVAPRIQAEVIPDAGHGLTFVRPEMVHEKILGSLARP